MNFTQSFHTKLLRAQWMTQQKKSQEQDSYKNLNITVMANHKLPHLMPKNHKKFNSWGMTSYDNKICYIIYECGFRST